MTAAQDSIHNSDAIRLATLMGLSTGGDRLWQTEELGAILRHQLTTPVQYDLRGLSRGDVGRLKALAAAEGLLLNSFGDLLQHENPPLELLRLTKDFAKACRISPESPLPPDVAAVLYYASIASAMIRCRTRITKLSDSDLRAGLAWCLEQTWLDTPTRELLKEAEEMLPANHANGRE